MPVYLPLKLYHINPPNMSVPSGNCRYQHLPLELEIPLTPVQGVARWPCQRRSTEHVGPKIQGFNHCVNKQFLTMFKLAWREPKMKLPQPEQMTGVMWHWTRCYIATTAFAVKPKVPPSSRSAQPNSNHWLPQTACICCKPFTLSSV